MSTGTNHHKRIEWKPVYQYDVTPDGDLRDVYRIVPAEYTSISRGVERTYTGGHEKPAGAGWQIDFDLRDAQDTVISICWFRPAVQ